MVSLQTTLSSEEKRSCCSFDKPVPKKRKWEDEEESDSDFFANEFANEPRIKQAKAEETTKVDIELHLDSPLPLEWQRCLDIKSGRMYFYNTRTHKRTSKDPRESPEEAAPSGPSLDLELNLACEPAKPTRTDKNPKAAQNQPKLLAPPPPWADGDHREMVAAVCMRCHMLVMMCKSTLSCPNCKFVHPPSHNSQGSLNKPGFKLLCL
ncbi:uncharacterized protein LOC109721242 [Ananas comosus]|uniref:Uncharacterized protein LOC109721242 n=1 Tax=Ananas comosus TaxID=4615 RepID=A0A6P5G6U3_ANACO|nr:uncharacterized protein LOC109721242 [Ananas comosus]